jgi:cell division protein FtsB
MTSQPDSTSSSTQAQQRGRRLLGGFFFFIICVLVVDALVGDQGVVATTRARKRYDQLAADLARLRGENAGLREEARRLKEDPAAIEELARRELGLMSPGEQLFIVKDVDPPASR